MSNQREFVLQLQSNEKFENFCPEPITQIIPQVEFLSIIDKLNKILANRPSTLRFIWILLVPIIISIIFFTKPEDNETFEAANTNSIIGGIILGFGLIFCLAILAIIRSCILHKSIEGIREKITEFNLEYQGRLQFRLQEKTTTIITNDYRSSTDTIGRRSNTRRIVDYELVVYIVSPLGLPQDAIYVQVDPTIPNAMPIHEESSAPKFT